MELYIRIVDGKTFEHPILGDNFRDAFPHVDVDNLHQYEEYAKFERITQADAGVFPGVYQTVECTYTKRDDGVWQDTWTLIDYTAEEKAEKIAKFQADVPKPFESWNFDEATCSWMPPVARPVQTMPLPEGETFKFYRWNESIVNWEEFTPEAPPETPPA